MEMNALNCYQSLLMNRTGNKFTLNLNLNSESKRSVTFLLILTCR